VGGSHTPKTTWVAKYLALVTVDSSTYAHSTTLASLLKPRRICGYGMVSTCTGAYAVTHRVHRLDSSMGHGEGGGSLSTREER
jgi:hypothetical protein